MKRFMQIVALVGAMLLMSAPAWSDNPFNHVSQAPGGKGDVLIFPMYMVLDGSFETKIQVVNTKENASAVAKVVLRSPVYSEEIRDFFIFLSPTDMWEGTIRMEANQVVVHSTDPSTLTSSEPTFASEANPFQVSVINPGCDDTNIYGYVEVFLSYVFDRNRIVNDATINLTEPVVPKANIYNAYVRDGSLLSPNPDPVAGAAPINLEREYRNILAGNFQIEVPAAGWASALNAVALKDFGLAAAAGLLETSFADDSLNSMVEVEAALAKNFIGMTYNNDVTEFNNTLHFFNFPTKLALYDFTECELVGLRGEYTGFSQGPKKGVQVGIRAMDMEEKTITPDLPIISPFEPGEAAVFPDELSFNFPMAFEKGWYRYQLDNGPTIGQFNDEDYGDIRYYGAPVIPFSMNYGSSGFSMMYGFWTDGQVEWVGVDDEGVDFVLPLQDYQYAQGWVVTEGMLDDL